VEVLWCSQVRSIINCVTIDYVHLTGKVEVHCHLDKAIKGSFGVISLDGIVAHSVVLIGHGFSIDSGVFFTGSKLFLTTGVIISHAESVLELIHLIGVGAGVFLAFFISALVMIIYVYLRFAAPPGTRLVAVEHTVVIVKAPCEAVVSVIPRSKKHLQAEG